MLSQKPGMVRDDRPARNNTSLFRSLLRLWYSFSAPDEDMYSPQQDIIRRGQIASILLLVSFIVCLAFLPAAITSDGMHVLISVLVMLAVTCVAIVLNKRGHVTTVGVLLVGTLDFALIFSLLSYPNFVLPMNALPIYDLFVLSDIIAVSLLPKRSILYVSLFHSIFMCANIALQPHSPELQRLVAETGYSFMVRPLTIQFVVALVMYLWVHNTLKAIERANKAEVIAQLERQISDQKRELDAGIQDLLHTLVQAANGDLSVRVPLVRENVLWQVDVALNTLLSRQQRTSLSEIELHKTRTELRRLLYEVREAKRRQNTVRGTPGGTEVDLLISELLGHYVVNSAREVPRRL